jgi:hypothetical protein
MKQLLVGRGGGWVAMAAAAALGVGLLSQAALGGGALDYSQSLGADFTATYPGAVHNTIPTANPFGPSNEWELHDSTGSAAGLISTGGAPASGQPGWCEGSAGVCTTGGPWTYFANFWQPGVTINPLMNGHGPQEVQWTAPASIDAGGVSISGAIEQIFETSRVMRLSVFKNGSATASFTVDALPPIVNGVILQKVNFGPIDIAVSPGDTLRLLMDGSGAGGNGIPTFVAWDVTLAEAAVVIPEPASAALFVIVGAVWFAGRRRHP